MFEGKTIVYHHNPNEFNHRFNESVKLLLARGVKIRELVWRIAFDDNEGLIQFAEIKYVDIVDKLSDEFTNKPYR